MARNAKKNRWAAWPPGATKAVALFAAFLSLTCGAVLAAVLLIPADLPVTEPYNTPARIMAGGGAVLGDERVFFSTSAGLYAAENAAKPTVRKISDKPARCLQYNQGLLYYVQDGTLFSAFFDGSMKRERLRDVDEVQIFGNWYYFTRGGRLFKQKTDGTHLTDLNLRPEKFLIYAQSVYYTEAGKTGLFKARTDGTGSVRVLDRPVTAFCVSGNYIFYRNDEGTFSAYLSDPSVGDSFGKTDAFQTENAALYYLKEGKLLHLDLDKSAVSSGDRTDESGFKIKELAEAPDCDVLYLCGDYLYFGNEKGAVFRVRSDGTEYTELLKPAGLQDDVK